MILNLLVVGLTLLNTIPVFILGGIINIIVSAIMWVVGATWFIAIVQVRECNRILREERDHYKLYSENLERSINAVNIEGDNLCLFCNADCGFAGTTLADKTKCDNFKMCFNKFIFGANKK